MVSPTPTGPASGSPSGDLEAWQHLGYQILWRRVALGYRRRYQFARATGLTTRLLGDLERGDRGNFSAATLAAVEKALGWAPGAHREVLAGRPARLRGAG